MPMTKKQYLAALAEFDLTIVGASVFGISRRQAQRLAAKDGPPIPEPLAKLIKLMLKRKVKPSDLE